MDTNDLAVDYFDGRSARPRRAWLRERAGVVSVWPQEQDAMAALAQAEWAKISWPERMAAGVRMAQLPNGGSVQSADAKAWDTWVAQHAPQREGWVTRAQQSWRGALVALVVLVAGLGITYVWGLPWVSRAVVAVVPHAVDESIGNTAMPELERFLLKPTRLSLTEQQHWRSTLAQAVEKTYAPSDTPRYRLEFRASRIGPNAFALPGGIVVLTDELVALARQSGDLAEAMVIGVLAHELGHVRARHGMRHLVSSSILSVIAGALLGDFSSLLAALPLWLGQAQYSRDAEREADAEARKLMLAAGYSPLAMVKFFESVRTYAADEARRKCIKRVEQEAQKRAQESGNTDGAKADTSECEREATEARREASTSGLGIAFSSHPADTERIEAFRRAAR